MKNHLSFGLRFPTLLKVKKFSKLWQSHSPPAWRPPTPRQCQKVLDLIADLHVTSSFRFVFGLRRAANVRAPQHTEKSRNFLYEDESNLFLFEVGLTIAPDKPRKFHRDCSFHMGVHCGQSAGNAPGYLPKAPPLINLKSYHTSHAWEPNSTNNFRHDL